MKKKSIIAPNESVHVQVTLMSSQVKWLNQNHQEKQSVKYFIDS